LGAIRAVQAQMDEINLPAHGSIDTFARYIDLNEAFHCGIVDLAKSPMLRRALDKVMSLPFAGRSALVYVRAKLPEATALFTLSQAHHHSLIEAIANRQSARAENLAKEHALLSRRNLEFVFDDQALLSHVPGSSLIKQAVTQQ